MKENMYDEVNQNDVAI